MTFPLKSFKCFNESFCKINYELNFIQFQHENSLRTQILSTINSNTQYHSCPYFLKKSYNIHIVSMYNLLMTYIVECWNAWITASGTRKHFVNKKKINWMSEFLHEFQKIYWINVLLAFSLFFRVSFVMVKICWHSFQALLVNFRFWKIFTTLL